MTLNLRFLPRIHSKEKGEKINRLYFPVREFYHYPLVFWREPTFFIIIALSSVLPCTYFSRYSIKDAWLIHFTTGRRCDYELQSNEKRVPFSLLKKRLIDSSLLSFDIRKRFSAEFPVKWKSGHSSFQKTEIYNFSIEKIIIFKLIYDDTNFSFFTRKFPTIHVKLH